MMKKNELALTTEQVEGMDWTFYRNNNFYEEGGKDGYTAKVYWPDKSVSSKRKFRVLCEGRLSIKAARNLREAKRLKKEEKEILKQAEEAFRAFKSKVSSSTGRGPNRRDFLAYIKDLIENKDFSNPQYKGPYRKLKKYVDLQLNSETLTFDRVDLNFLEEFLAWLKKQPGKKGGTFKSVRAYMKVLQIFWNHAFKREVVDFNPFQRFNDLNEKDLKRQQPETFRLNKEQLSMLESSDLSEDEIIRKAFLFSCYTGLRYSDVSRITWKKNIDFENELLAFRQKKSSSKWVQIPISPAALRLLDTLDQNSIRVFPNMPEKSSPANLKLKKWAKEVGLKLNFSLSWHKSRHTFATLVFNATGDIEATRDLLGHADIAQTLRYSKMDKTRSRKALTGIFS